jgi:hypothetical protein
MTQSKLGCFIDSAYQWPARRRRQNLSLPAAASLDTFRILVPKEGAGPCVPPGINQIQSPSPGDKREVVP